MKTIYIIIKRSGEYESQPEILKAFESEIEAEKYKERITIVFWKLYLAYDELAGHPSYDEIVKMEESVYNIFDLYSTKRNKYYDMHFHIEKTQLVGRLEEHLKTVNKLLYK